ncbi:hypothetical protein [Planctellipticum variicoloris]|uniref:hypothetical protein n=1 Tax=Planctellipticum variicoloris TaxID=3064265 RepID=UPI002CDB2352|nr:hypothetical protein SH412_001638 [Planctomycetaceae bacterium SH412]HTN03139.1 hypothetical protein [Planctomycetaceae bacterium]
MDGPGSGRREAKLPLVFPAAVLLRVCCSIGHGRTTAHDWSRRDSPLALWLFAIVDPLH